MIGFDRPLKPQWIYESLLLAQPGQRMSELNKPFEQIAKELTGKEGKRKVRTVLFRCFLRDKHNKARVRSELPLKDLSIRYGPEFMYPIYLFYLIGKTESLYKISAHLFRLYDFGGTINMSFLKKCMINEFGERDVVSRSAGALLKTLIYFGVVDKADSNLILKQRLPVDDRQLRIMFELYSREIAHAPQISINDLPAALFNYFKLPEVKVVAQKYNGDAWDYQHRVGADLLIMH